MRNSIDRPRAFTLVELLVVIAIIGILVALLLPAVQQAREAARRVQCTNQVRQLALAAILHENTHGFFPTGGWSVHWTADPNRGFGKRQPGGWAYSVLPFIEESAKADLGRGVDSGTAAYRLAMNQLHSSPITGFNCPTRRTSDPTPHRWLSATNAPHVVNLPAVVKSDYAINGGDGRWSAGDPPEFEVPDSYADADGETNFQWTVILPKPGRYSSQIYANGISHQRSEVKLRNVSDGTSKTYLIGEKSMLIGAYGGWDPSNPDSADWGGNQSMYTGYDWDNTRLTRFGLANDKYRPRRDQLTPSTVWYAFGSAHSGGLNMSLCDGSVQTVSYDVDRTVHRYFGARNDAQSVAVGDL